MYNVFLHFTDTHRWGVLKNHNFPQIVEILPRKLQWWTSAFVYNDLVWKTFINFLNLDHFN